MSLSHRLAFPQLRQTLEQALDAEPRKREWFEEEMRTAYASSGKTSDGGGGTGEEDAAVATAAADEAWRSVRGLMRLKVRERNDVITLFSSIIFVQDSPKYLNVLAALAKWRHVSVGRDEGLDSY